MARSKHITIADTEIALKVYPDLIGALARAKDLVEKRARLDRVERAQLERGKATRAYAAAQVEEARAVEALRQCLASIPLPEVPYPR